MERKVLGKAIMQYAVLSETGDRAVNEDALAVAEKPGQYCFAVCDGLGGHGMGDEASRLVADTFVSRFRDTPLTDTCLAHSFTAAQERLLARQAERRVHNQMKTTACVLMVHEDNAFIGHIGDSRVYVFSQGKILCRTLDHSVPQMLALSGKITDAQIREHPDRNILLRAMGTPWEKPMFTIMEPISLDVCDAFLLCSDGFWECIEETQMLHTLQSSATAEQWLHSMTQIVRDRGCGKKMDNYSAIAVWKQNGGEVL